MIQPSRVHFGFAAAFAKPALKVRFGNEPVPPGNEEAGNSRPLVDRLKAEIREFPDFPKPGIAFKDILPVLKNPKLFEETLEYFANFLKEQKIKYVAGIESRGFMLGAPLAQKIGAGFIPIRKAGKLPGEVEKQKYELEYGTDAVEIQSDAIEPGANVVLVDDLLATGGTAAAATKLLNKLKVNLKSILFMVELDALNGRKKLEQPDGQGPEIHSLIHY